MPRAEAPEQLQHLLALIHELLTLDDGTGKTEAPSLALQADVAAAAGGGADAPSAAGDVLIYTVAQPSYIGELLRAVGIDALCMSGELTTA